MPEVKVHWKMNAAKSTSAAFAADLLESTDFRVDVSMYPRFENGKFETLTPLVREAGTKAGASPRASSLVASNLRPGIYYSARVLAATPDGWVASETVSFLTPVCPVDGID
jgi:hypothetical protein